jgi:hypothetical protein
MPPLVLVDQPAQDPCDAVSSASRIGDDGRTLYRFRTRYEYCDLRFGRIDGLRQDRGLCLFACST